MRWPKGPPHLALNPPYFFGFCFLFVVFFCFFCFFLVFVFFVSVFFGGFKGQVRWPKGPLHLALNPPYLFIFCFFVLFLFFFPLPFLYLLLNRKTLFPPPQKRQILFIYLCFPLFLFSLVWASPFFPFLFLCLSLVIFFLPSFLFFHLSFWFFLFLFVWFASWFKMLCCFSFSACCLLLF